jgi:chemotaxis protein CheC
MEKNELIFWSQIASRGMTEAAWSLSRLCGQEFSIGSFALRQVAMRDIPQLMGGAETEAVGIYVVVSGEANGHLMLLFDPGIACGFVDLLMGLPGGTTQRLGEMEESALAEMGNILGSSFLTVLADSTGTTLRPSPPIILRDMAGALLDVVAADILLVQDHAFVAETTFQAPDREISGLFLVVPRQDLLSLLVERGRAA